MKSSRVSLLVICLLMFHAGALFANGGAWPTGVPSAGNAAPSDNARTTGVTIEDEKLTLNLRQEFADVAVRFHIGSAKAGSSRPPRVSSPARQPAPGT